MLHSGQVLETTVLSQGYQGEGVCRVDGRVVFVPFALPGEEVRLEINSLQKNYAAARLIEVLEPSPQRVVPPCPVFTRCGGCALQHQSYSDQLEAKRQASATTFLKVAGLQLQPAPAIGLDQPWHYRNKTTWQLQMEDGQPVAGFFATGSKQLIKATDCLIAHPDSVIAVQAVLAWMKQANVAAYDLRTSSGLLHQLVTRHTTSGQMMLILVSQGLELPSQGELVRHLRDALPSLQSLILQVEEDRNSLSQPRLRTLWGQDSLAEETDQGLKLKLSPLSFFQVNHMISRQMYAHVLDQAIRTPKDVLVDVYCGTGTLSLLAARRCNQVLGIELMQEAVADANLNAETNGMGNARFIAGPAEVELPKLVQAGQRMDALILDPPRKGVHTQVLDAVLQARPGRIVYISCHPASQARDVARLIKAGYEILTCQPFDMFCHTAETENVITLIRREP